MKRINVRTLLLSTGLLASLATASSVAAASVNLALGQPASASSSWPGYSGQYAVANGNDGRLDTAWNGGTWAAWWQVDLQVPQSINLVTVASGDGPGYHISFQLSSSTDGTQWSNLGALTTGSGPAWSFSFDTSGQAMRYIRYTTLGDTGSDWATLAELQAVGAVPEPAASGLMAAGLAMLGWAARRRRRA